MSRRDDHRKRDGRAAPDAVERACLLGEAADAAPAMIWVSDAQGAITQVNRHWVEFIGYEPEASGEGWAANVHPDDFAAYRESLLHAVLERTRLRREYRLRRHDGAWRWIEDTAEPRFDPDGRYLGHSGAAVDNTDQHAALEALRLSDVRFRRFTEVSDDLYWAGDAAAGRILFANSALERVWGASRERLFSENQGYWRTLIHPDDLPRLDRAMRQLRRGRARTVTYRVFRARDGAERVVEDRAFPIRDEGAIRLVGGMLRDITDRVHAHEELERRVAERTAELEASNEERRKAEAALAQAQRLETVGRLTGGLAHDFNNLLTVMIGALDMIQRRPGEPERVQRLGQAALEAGRRGERLTRKLLSFSRRQPLRIDTVSISDAIRDFEPMLRGAVGEETALALQVEPGLGARLDRALFEAALLNLAVNSRDALGPGGAIRLNAERIRLGESEVQEVPAGDYVLVSVIDTGVGMTPEVAAHAFEPFFTTKRDSGGTGLGLAQVHGFACQTGGGVQIRSAPGEGATVSLYLPWVPPPPERPAAGPEGAPPPSLEGLRVLVVDDDAAVRTTAEGLLQELDCEVLTAPDGPSAISVLERDPNVRLLFTDVVMPGMNGVDLAHAAQVLRPELKVLLSTGYASDRVAPSATDYPVLRKPYRIIELEGAVRQATA
jgi:PAS domain S-box-containing protein